MHTLTAMCGDLGGSGSQLDAAIAELYKRALEYERWRIEQACEAAVQGGLYGVLIQRDGAKLIDVRVDPSVPYGQIYEMRPDIVGGMEEDL